MPNPLVYINLVSVKNTNFNKMKLVYSITRGITQKYMKQKIWTQNTKTFTYTSVIFLPVAEALAKDPNEGYASRSFLTLLWLVAVFLMIMTWTFHSDEVAIKKLWPTSCWQKDSKVFFATMKDDRWASVRVLSIPITGPSHAIRIF